jgi:hypothetical protein
VLKTLTAFQLADQNWSRELQRQFGKRAGDVRYTAEGRSGAKLRKLHDKFVAARVAWEADLAEVKRGGK